MNIAFIYAHDNEGCAPRETLRAFRTSGHNVHIMSVEMYRSLRVVPKDVDLFFCQDSGEGINFTGVNSHILARTSMWYWDSRFNRIQRSPGDDDMAEYITNRGGWVFQAQSPDVERLHKHGIKRCSYLPIAVDETIWRNDPTEIKIHDASFIGNCYDNGRALALAKARERQLYWPGANSTFYYDAAKVYRQSLCVFHAPTFYGQPHDVTHERIDYDLTMRPYEALACGVPFVSPALPDFERNGFVEGLHWFEYKTLDDIPNAIDRATDYAKSQTSAYSDMLRDFIVGRHTYSHRIKSALATLVENGVIDA